MTDEQKAAFITAQTALMSVELKLMESENVERERKCQAPANGPEQYAAFLAKWDAVLGYNALIQFFRQ